MRLAKLRSPYPQPSNVKTIVILEREKTCEWRFSGCDRMKKIKKLHIGARAAFLAVWQKKTQVTDCGG
jgi:hypothetical protein